MASVRFCVYEWFSTLGRRQVDDLKKALCLELARGLSSFCLRSCLQKAIDPALSSFQASKTDIYSQTEDFSCQTRSPTLCRVPA